MNAWISVIFSSFNISTIPSGELSCRSRNSVVIFLNVELEKSDMVDECFPLQRLKNVLVLLCQRFNQMGDEIINKTIECLSKIIKKPPLNKKLLSKPPFRYLHDLFSEVIRTTGAFEGLYNETEMNSESFKVLLLK